MQSSLISVMDFDFLDSTILIKVQIYARFLTKILDPVKSHCNQSVCKSKII